MCISSHRFYFLVFSPLLAPPVLRHRTYELPVFFVPAKSAASETWEIKCREYASRVGRAASKKRTPQTGLATVTKAKCALRFLIRCHRHLQGTAGELHDALSGSKLASEARWMPA